MAFFVKNCNKNFQKCLSSIFYCDSIYDLHLCDNFGAFYINIENFIGKNSEKITRSISYTKVKTPRIELVISSEPS